MTEEYLIERLRDKDVAIEDLLQTVTSLKKELLDIHDWITDYIKEEKNSLFEFEQLQARILGSVRLVPSHNLS